LSPLPLPARAAPRQLHSFPTRRSSDLALQSRCKALHIASPLPYLSIGVVEADYRHRGSPALSKVVTVHDVAAKANVSTASVSRVINGSAFVSDATSRKVRIAIDELGFEPNSSARKLRQQQTHNI